MKLVKLIANLGYGSRKDVALMFREGRITDSDGEVLYADDKVAHEHIRVDDEPLDPPAGIVLMMHKPLGATCSRKDLGRVVYDLLPPRYRVTRSGAVHRRPAGSRNLRPAAVHRRRRAAAPDHLAQGQRAQGLRGHPGQ